LPFLFGHVTGIGFRNRHKINSVGGFTTEKKSQSPELGVEERLRGLGKIRKNLKKSETGSWKGKRIEEGGGRGESLRGKGGRMERKNSTGKRTGKEEGGERGSRRTL
jgi:hypothetical protein